MAVVSSFALPLSPLSLQVRRATATVVGRATELAAIREQLEGALGGSMAGITVEGEPGIGKTRLLLAAAQAARTAGFTVVGVSADEELRGPFLLARSILASPEVGEVASGTPAEEAVARGLEVLAGRDDPSLETMPAEQKLLRTFDLAAVAIREAAAQRPLALLVDDLQWTDEDSLRLLRYCVRSVAASQVFMMFALRPEEFAFVTEAVTLIADMERMGLVRRFRLSRFSQLEAGEFLRQILGSRVHPTSGASMHAQAEGVPFILEEIAHAYRDAGMIQQIDGVWTLAKNADRLVPSAVRTLIQRRAARLPDDTRLALAEAAILGRRFSVRDLCEVKTRLGEECVPDRLSGSLAPAVSAGLLVEHPEGSAADYTFTHEQVREFASAILAPARRRAIHSAIVTLLTAGGDPPPESLPMLVYHAKAAGDAEVCVRLSIGAASVALAAHAPEEVVRVVDEALPAASAAQDRVALLQARDQALEMLRRTGDRLEGLAELSALVEALGDTNLELEIRLRRAGALRAAEEYDAAAEISRQVRRLAVERGEERAELAACLELGQDLLRVALGESYVPTASEVDLDGAEEAFARAAAIAEALGEDASLAAASRELGVVSTARVRAWFVERVQRQEHVPWMMRVAAGEPLEQVIGSLPISRVAKEASARFGRALQLFEKLGDRRGVMSSIIGLAYVSWGPDIHLGPGAARHIEEIRRLSGRMSSLTTESERAHAELQMLYGVHVFSRAKGIPDLALSRGEEAFRAARVIGDRAMEFLAAGGTALMHVEMGEVGEAERWLDRAAAAAAQSPTPLRARQLAMWRGTARAAAGDPEGLLDQMNRAVQLATEQGSAAARCETLARLGLEAARLGADRSDEALLRSAEESAREAGALVESLPGHPPWGAQAQAALAQVHTTRGEVEAALEAARSVAQWFLSAQSEDLHLEMLVPSARAIVASGDPEEQAMTRGYVQTTLAMIAQRTLDEDVRVRWFRSPLAAELAKLAGPLDLRPAEGSTEGGASLDESEMLLLRFLIEGRTNREIAEETGMEEEAVARRLAEMFAKIGASSRAEATAFAFRERMV